ncbi:hypothetical protein [Listeria floridensis]|nr:hypothetical protein [Listeria floridensis]
MKEAKVGLIPLEKRKELVEELTDRQMERRLAGETKFREFT